VRITSIDLTTPIALEMKLIEMPFTQGNGDAAGSKLDKARGLGVEVWDEERFLGVVGG
jgi:hypothetical protein